MATADSPGPAAADSPGPARAASVDAASVDGVVDQQRLIDALARTSYVTMAVLSRIGAAHDLSLTQLRVLAILRDRRIKMSELARYLGLDKSTVSGLVDRAEKRGLLRRAPNPIDKRATDVHLTAAGLNLAAQGAAEIAGALAPLTGTLSRREADRLTTVLERMLMRPPAVDPPARHERSDGDFRTDGN